MTRGYAGTGALNPHGTTARYNAGCHCQKCRDNEARYYTLRMMGRVPKPVGAVRGQRRLRALGALGWSTAQIGERLGVSGTRVAQMQVEDRLVMHRATFDAVCRVYHEMCMTRPPELTPDQKSSAVRARNRAKRKGWVPPLAWDNIDDPDARPVKGWRRSQYGTRFDLDEWMHLVHGGMPVWEATKHCGVGLAGVARAAERSGREDARALVSAEFQRERYRREAA